MGKKKIDKNQKKQKNKKNQKEDKEENKADFYLDDADADLAYNSSELEEESEHGSELDFDEKDYVSSEEEEQSKEEEEKPKWYQRIVNHVWNWGSNKK